MKDMLKFVVTIIILVIIMTFLLNTLYTSANVTHKEDLRTLNKSYGRIEELKYLYKQAETLKQQSRVKSAKIEAIKTQALILQAIDEHEHNQEIKRNLPLILDAIRTLVQ